MDNNGYRLLLPEGTLDYFIISDVKESASEIVIYLEEKNEVPKEYAGMKVESKGFLTCCGSGFPHTRQEAFSERAPAQVGCQG